jgi:CDP-diacylglycerol--glycerol-3-phosphate 3-phosphatidyltransferase
MVALVGTDTLWWFPVALISGRELIISVYRSYMARRGVSIPARQWAKVKTFVQSIAVGFALLPLTADHRWIANSALWASVAFTLVTGAQYLLDGRTTVAAARAS